MEERKPKSIIAELGGILVKGDFVYRFIKMEDGSEGEHWSKERKTLEAQDELFTNKTQVEYTWQKGAQGKGDKLRVYAPKEDAKPDSGKRKSDWAKNSEGKDSYWKDKSTFDENKFEWEKVRYTRNDSKLEMQSVRQCIAPFYVQAYVSGDLKLAEAITQLEATTIAIYNRHNPTKPAADVSK